MNDFPPSSAPRASLFEEGNFLPEPKLLYSVVMCLLL